jgi:hypothetical protein
MDYEFLDGLERALEHGGGGSEYRIGCLLSRELERVAHQVHQANTTDGVTHCDSRKRKPEWAPDWQVGAGSDSRPAPGTSPGHLLHSEDDAGASLSMRRWVSSAAAACCLLTPQQSRVC